MAEKRKFKPAVQKRVRINDRTNWSEGSWADTVSSRLRERMDPAGAERDRIAAWHAGKEQEQALQPDYGLLMAPQDMARGVGQYVAGEAAAAAGVDPVGLLMSGAEAVGVPPEYALAAAGGLLGGKALRKAGKAAAKEATVKRGLLSPFKQSIQGYDLEPDVVKSLQNEFKSNPVPAGRAELAAKNRAALRAEKSPFDKPLSQMTDSELKAIGDQYGVNMEVGPMVPVFDEETGRTFLIPNGLEKPFSYTDLIQLKAQGYDPNDMGNTLRNKLMRRFGEAATPSAATENMEPVDVFNRAAFGILSANAPLTQSEITHARMKAHSLEDLQKLAGYAPGGVGPKDPKERWALDAQIAQDFGIQAASKGGIGSRSSSNLVDVAELAAKVLKDPAAYRKKPDEDWVQFVERQMNQAAGLSTKTSAMGGVFFDPTKADMAPMDRHMARLFLDKVLATPGVGDQFRKSTLNVWNNQASRPVKTWNEFMKQDGAELFLLDHITSTVNNPKSAQVLDKKTGGINPRVPAHLAHLPGDKEGKVYWAGDQYRTMIDENRKDAQKNNLSLFLSQWKLWDGIRQKLEPHEMMYRDSEKLPRLSGREMLDVDKVYRDAGYYSPGPVQPFDWKKGLYWTAPPILAGGLLGPQNPQEPSKD